MSITLLKKTFKDNWVLLLIFAGVLSMYSSVMLTMYDPNNAQSMADMLNMLPAEIVAAFGMTSVATDLVGFLAGYLYGLLMFGFPLVYAIILANRLVAKQVDNGSFAYLLSTPNSRSKIIITQGVYAVLSMIALFIIVTLVGITMANSMFPGLMNMGEYLKLNMITCLVCVLVIMISFFFSCLFNDTKKSLAFGAGVPLTFLLMQMLGGAAKDIEFLKKISIYGWYNPSEIVNSSSIWGMSFIYIGISIVLFIASIMIFKRKKLPL